MLREVRQELDRIEDFLMQSNQASADLAMILSALRGPDHVERGYEEDSIKERTTSPLRTMVFPRLYEAAMFWAGSKRIRSTTNIWRKFSRRCWGMRPASEFKVNFTDGDPRNNHFLLYIELAKEAIDRKDP